MYPRGHAGISLIIVSILGLLIDLSIIEFSLLAIIVMWFSIIPDIDIIGVYNTSFIIHRGFSHTVWFGVICSIITYIIYRILFLMIESITLLTIPSSFGVIISVGSFVGIVSHTIGDTLNDTGVRPLYIPLIYDCPKISVLNIKSDSKFYNNLFFILGTLLITLFVTCIIIL